MHFDAGEWKIGATQARAHGPVVGEMVFMVWGNAAAKNETPLGVKAFGALGEVCRRELAVGVSGLRTKGRGKLV